MPWHMETLPNRVDIQMIRHRNIHDHKHCLQNRTAGKVRFQSVVLKRIPFDLWDAQAQYLYQSPMEYFQVKGHTLLQADHTSKEDVSIHFGDLQPAELRKILLQA